MPRIEAIIRTAEQRIRPVLLTTITTMAGLAPMMFGRALISSAVATPSTAPQHCGGNSWPQLWCLVWGLPRF